MDLQRLTTLSFELGELLKERNLSFTCAESCTGGWLGQAITSVPGCSEWFGSGFVTYSYEAKVNVLGVKKRDLDNFGAVSEQIVKQMVAGALVKAHANIGVAISGIAGPDGGTDSKPVGTVCFAWKVSGSKPISLTQTFNGDRNQVRYFSVKKALLGTICLIKDL